MKKTILAAMVLAFLCLAGSAMAGIAEIQITGAVPDTVLQAGDSFTLRIELENIGTAGATDITYEVIAGSAISGYTVGRVGIGGVSDGGSRAIELPLTLSSTAATGEHQITVKVRYSGGLALAQETFTVRVGSSVNLQLIEVLFDPEKLEPGKTVKVTATVKNYGDSVQNVVAAIDFNSTDIKTVLAGAEDFASKISAGAAETFEFILSVDSDAETGTYASTLTLDYEDEFGLSGSDEIDVGLPVTGTPRLDLLKAGVDDGRFEVEVQNLGTAKARAIKAELIQEGAVKDVDVENELKPDKKKTFRYTTFAAGPGVVKLTFLDPANTEYTAELPVSAESAAGSGGGVSKTSLVLFLLVVGEGYYIYRLRKKGKG